METGSEAGSSQDLPPSANQPTRSEPADEVPPAAMVEHDDPTDECVGVTTCTTNESSPDSRKEEKGQGRDIRPSP